MGLTIMKYYNSKIMNLDLRLTYFNVCFLHFPHFCLYDSDILPCIHWFFLPNKVCYLYFFLKEEDMFPSSALWCYMHSYRSNMNVFNTIVLSQKSFYDCDY